MSKARIPGILCCVVIGTAYLSAQLFVSPYVGIKTYGLNGAMVNSSGGSVSGMGIGDASKTGFTVGATGGMTMMKAGIYSLDAAVDLSFASVGLMEEGYNSARGPGKFSADGLSGLTTTALEIDLMPIHRISLPALDLISPYGGVGLALTFFSNSDLTVGPPSSSTPSTVKGAGNTKVGLIFFYGAVVNVGLLHPYVQFKHLVPFGDEFQFTDDPTNGSVVSIKDSPGYFSLTAGIMFSL